MAQGSSRSPPSSRWPCPLLPAARGAAPLARAPRSAVGPLASGSGRSAHSEQDGDPAGPASGRGQGGGSGSVGVGSDKVVAPAGATALGATATTTAPLTDNQQQQEQQLEPYGGLDAATPPYSWPALEPPFLFQASAEAALSGSAPCGLPPLWRLLLLSDGSVTRHLQLLTGSPVTVECLSMRNVGWLLEGFPPGTELIPGPRVQRQVLLRCQSSGPGNLGAEAVGGTGSSSGASARPPSVGGSAEASGVSNGGSSDTSSSSRAASPTPSSGSSGSHARSSGAAIMGGATGGAAVVRSGDGAGSRGAADPGDESGPAGGTSGVAGGPGSGGGGGAPLVYASSWWNAGQVDEYLRDKSKPIWISLSQGHVELYREVHALFAAPGSPELEQLLGCPGPFWGRQYIFWSGGRPLTLIYEVFSPRLGDYVGAAPGGAAGAHGQG